MTEVTMFYAWCHICTDNLGTVCSYLARIFTILNVIPTVGANFIWQWSMWNVSSTRHQEALKWKIKVKIQNILEVFNHVQMTFILGCNDMAPRAISYQFLHNVTQEKQLQMFVGFLVTRPWPGMNSSSGWYPLGFQNDLWGNIKWPSTKTTRP